ncbi:hypothetical protein Efla_002300 [Eimeria flavescens]
MDAVHRLSLVAVIFVAATLASGAGTGGGALYIPGYVVSLRDVHKAVPLSKVTILGGCLVSVLVNVRRRHPKSNAPLIAYELAALMEPFTLLGAVIGVLLNIVMSDLQILVCLVLTLSFTCYKTFRRGLMQRAEETRILKQLETQRAAKEPAAAAVAGDCSLSSLADGSRAELEQLLPASEREQQQQQHLIKIHSAAADRLDVGSVGDDTTFFPSSEGLLSMQRAGSASLLPFPAGEEQSMQNACGTCRVSLLYLVADSLLNVLLLILAGGPAALLCGSQWQQGCIYLLLSCHVLGTFLFVRWLRRRQAQLQAAGCKGRELAEGGLSWLTPLTAFVYPVLSLLAGVLAGAIGIGGGLVKGPLLLEIGLSPLAAVSTANFMIFFTSSANTLQYAILGRLELTDSVCFFLVAFAAGAAGG